MYHSCTSASPSINGTWSPTNEMEETRPLQSDEQPSCDHRRRRTRKPTLDDLRREIQMDEHVVSLEELFTRLEVDPECGLSNDQVHFRQRRDGPNVITPPRQLPEFLKFLKNLVGGFALLLWAAAIMSLVAYGIQQATVDGGDQSNLFLGIILVALVLVTGMFTYYQEAKSERIMKSFLKMTPENTQVLREGRHRDVRVDSLVVGDIVEIEYGNRIPADIRLIKCSGFKVDNSSLTGESEPQSRNAHSSNPNPLESKNMAFFSTDAVEGTCTGVVVRTGDHTAMGRIARLTGIIKGEKTPLSVEIEHFVRLITIFAVGIGVIFFVISIFFGYNWFSAVIFLIGIITANVPEGLLPTLTVCLTLTAQRMKAKNCLVRKLEAVETLGSTSVICSDKTGTLTENKMTVSHLWYGEAVFNASIHPDLHPPNTNDVPPESPPGGTSESPLPENSESPPKGTPEKREPPPQSSKVWDTLARIIALCSRATFKEGQEVVRVVDRQCNGDASETALLKYYELKVGSVIDCRNRHPKIFEIPFNSANKYQLSIHDQPANTYLLVMKGAPEKVLEVCTTYLNARGQELPMSTTFTDNFEKVYGNLGNRGERVLGFAQKLLDSKLHPSGYEFDPDSPGQFLHDLCFVGVVSLVDPPRAAVPAAVARCRRAGIKVIMITGDHPTTAKAIARAVGIISPGVHTVDETLTSPIPIDDEAQAIAIHGSDLAEMKDYDIDSILLQYPEIIFARTSPTQKLRIVEGCQRAGLIVAVTGDGVNDAPALKKAHIGIAMGITGTDVAKQVSDIILLDDNFASIVTGIEEGRLLFDNLKKTIAYALTANIPELTPFLFYILASVPLPLGAIAIVLICIGTDIVPAISLAYEMAESQIMSRRPRDPQRDRLASHRLLYQSYAQIGMMEAAGGFLSYFVVMGECGFLPYTLIGLRSDWDSSTTIVQDSYGQDWGYEERKSLEFTCYTAFFVSIVLTQWADLIICKTRRNSFFKHGINNYYTIFALMSETCLAVVLAYCPAVSYYLTFREIRLEWCVVALSFSLFIFAYDEIRKAIIRWSNGGAIEKELLY